MGTRNVRLARQLHDYPVPNVAADATLLNRPLAPALRPAQARLRRAVERLQVWAVDHGVSVEGEDWDRLDAEIAAAFEAEDGPRAMAAVNAWEGHARRLRDKSTRKDGRR